MNCSACELNVPVVTAAMTVFWNDFGIPIKLSWRMRLEISWPLTSEPRTATPITEPSSRLVVVADAAMPERSGGTTARATEVTGTTAMPNPTSGQGERQDELGEIDVPLQRGGGEQQTKAGGQAADRHGLARADARDPAARQ